MCIMFMCMYVCILVCLGVGVCKYTSISICVQHTHKHIHIFFLTSWTLVRHTYMHTYIHTLFLTSFTQGRHNPRARMYNNTPTYTQINTYIYTLFLTSFTLARHNPRAHAIFFPCMDAVMRVSMRGMSAFKGSCGVTNSVKGCMRPLTKLDIHAKSVVYTCVC